MVHVDRVSRFGKTVRDGMVWDGLARVVELDGAGGNSATLLCCLLAVLALSIAAFHWLVTDVPVLLVPPAMVPILQLQASCWARVWSQIQTPDSCVLARQQSPPRDGPLGGIPCCHWTPFFRCGSPFFRTSGVL
jgi:hypothetical protein